MLRSLHIKNYILIDSLDIEFPEGLVIITGQTGAGKSILLGALSLLFGAKSDASQISAGATSCVVEAEFDASGPEVEAVLESFDVEPDGGTLTVRRVVSSTGRSRSFVNDSPVQLDLLKKISPMLVDIHSQHKTTLLRESEFQRTVLDGFALAGGSLSACRETWGKLRAVREQLAQLRDRLSRLEAEKDYNAAQFEQLSAASLAEGELESLEEEHRSLSHSEQIMEALSGAVSSLEGDEQRESLPAALKEVSRDLERVSSFLPAATELLSRVESSRIELEDISSEISGLLSEMNLSPKRLEDVEDRLSELYGLLKKFACADVAELIAKRDEFASSVQDTSELQERIVSLEKEQDGLYRRYREHCAELTGLRRTAAKEFASRIEASLAFLEMEGAKFEVAVEPGPEGPDGADKVCFLFSSTGGETRELSKVVSGGEMSRIMLCIKAEMARFSKMPTMVFDEIDTGVSGSVADKMGRMICEMGRSMQVFSITHLPQVAAKGDAHYVVSKGASADGRVVSRIRKVEGKERVMEVARLLSGEHVSEAAVANAESLLKEGRA